MGIDPAVSQKDNETMHWQERERQHIMELCQERGVEIEILGVDRDDYTIPEYKQAMRAKEAAEAEIEILHRVFRLAHFSHRRYRGAQSDTK